MALSIKVQSYPAHGGIQFDIKGETAEERALIRSLRGAQAHSRVAEYGTTSPYTPVLELFFPSRPETKKK